MSIYAQSRRGLLALAALLVVLPGLAQAQATLTVFAAASLTDSMKAVADVYQAKTGTKVTLSFGGSNTLAQQIDQGAQADLFLSADTDWMDFLQKNGRIDNATRRNLLGNRLVLIGGDKGKPLTIAPISPSPPRWATASWRWPTPIRCRPENTARRRLLLWGCGTAWRTRWPRRRMCAWRWSMSRAASLLMAIVYETDAKVDPAVHVAGIFPESSHPPIVYPVALTKSAGAQAKDFLAFLSGPECQGDLPKVRLHRPALARADIFA